MNGGLYAFPTASERVSYEVTSARRGRPTTAALRADRSAIPRDRGERFLQLPALVSRGRGARAPDRRGPRQRRRARARPRALPAPRTAATPTIRPPTGRRRALARRSRSCWSAPRATASTSRRAMVVLARSVGIPARLVNGFAGGEHERDPRLHRAAPVGRPHLGRGPLPERAGWVRYDPTPPDLRLAGASALSASDRFAALAERPRVLVVPQRDRLRPQPPGVGAAQAVGGLARAGARPREAARDEAGDRPQDGPPLPAAAPRGAGGSRAAREPRGGARSSGAARAGSRPCRPTTGVRSGCSRAAAPGARRATPRAASPRAPPERSAPAPALAFERVTELYLAERFGGARRPPRRAARRSARCVIACAGEPLRVPRSRRHARARHRLSPPRRGLRAPAGRAGGAAPARGRGFRLVIVTNQSGIGRGLFGEADFERFQARLLADLARAGVAHRAHLPLPPPARRGLRLPEARSGHAVARARRARRRPRSELGDRRRRGRRRAGGARGLRSGAAAPAAGRPARRAAPAALRRGRGPRRRRRRDRSERRRRAGASAGSRARRGAPPRRAPRARACARRSGARGRGRGA